MCSLVSRPISSLFASKGWRRVPSISWTVKPLAGMNLESTKGGLMSNHWKISAFGARVSTKYVGRTIKLLTPVEFLQLKKSSPETKLITIWGEERSLDECNIDDTKFGLLPYGTLLEEEK